MRGTVWGAGILKKVDCILLISHRLWYWRQWWTSWWIHHCIIYYITEWSTVVTCIKYSNYLHNVVNGTHKEKYQPRFSSCLEIHKFLLIWKRSTRTLDLPPFHHYDSLMTITHSHYSHIHRGIHHNNLESNTGLRIFLMTIKNGVICTSIFWISTGNCVQYCAQYYVNCRNGKL